MKIISQIPLEFIVFLGSIIEEVIPPLPSPLLLIVAKISMSGELNSIIYLLLLTCIAAVGKTIGSLFLYIVADKTEDLLTGRFRKWFKISHKEIESIGKRFNGTWKDIIILIFFRALPILPTMPISLICGIIKLNIHTYLVSTFIGSFIRVFL